MTKSAEKSESRRAVKPVPRSEWSAFFESFTLQHSAWLVNVDGEKEAMPLDRITASESGRIVIHLGSDLLHHRIITIDGASVGTAQQGGVTEAVEISSVEGRPTRLTFRSPMPPQLVDGVV
jgi:hypothetical protein